MAEPYVLQADARHEGDVKWVAAVPASAAADVPCTVLSAARDNTAATWMASGNTTEDLERGLVLAGHTGYVNVVVYVGRTAWYPSPLIATGSHDKNVILYDALTSDVVAVLTGHDDVVKTAAFVSDAGVLVTGSWDNSCIVWDLAACTLSKRVRAHTSNVLCVADFGGDEALSSSGDRTVVRFNVRSGEVLGRYAKHEDSVQAVVSLKSSRLFAEHFQAARLFASGGNDLNILIWDADQPKAPLAALSGHYAIVFSLAVNHHTGELLSTSDDSTLRFWQPTECSQCISHPDMVWSACVLAEADLVVSACADGAIRLWGRMDAGVISISKTETLSEAVAASKLPLKTTLPGVDLPALPEVAAAIAVPGSSEGERTFGRNGDFIEAYAWGQGRWDKIGVVVRDARDDGSNVMKPVVREKVYHDGQYYDYVFDVEIANVPLKLPYNRGQSIFDAAQQFIYDNAELGISQMDKEQIQNHILNSIDPADAALVGGGAGSGAAANSAGANYAFSEYAKELAEMEAKGQSDGKGSYRDEYKRMVNAGEVPSFSKFAQEEAEAQGRAAPAGAATGASTGGTTDVGAIVAQACADCPLFLGFNAAGAAKKLVEFGIAEAEASAVAAAFETAANAPEAAASFDDAVVQVIIFADQLQRGQKFPLLDMIRAAASRHMGALLEHAPGLVPIIGEALASTADADVERMVGLRCAVNIFAQAAASLSPDAPAAQFALQCFADPNLLSAIAVAVRRATSRQASAALKTAGLRLVSALAICISRLTDFFAADGSGSKETEGLVAAARTEVSNVATGLIIELDNANVKQFLRAALVLLCGPPGARADALPRQAARQAAAKEIFGIVRAKKEYGDPDVVSACKHIYDLLSPLVPP